MRTELIYFILILCVLVSGCSTDKSDLSKIPKKDKQEILRLVLETSIVKQQIPDYNLIKDKSNIVISSENIVKSDLPTFESVTFELLASNQIKQKAKREGDFLYLEITSIRQEGKSYIFSINNIWAYQNSPKMGYLSGGGFEVKYTKKNGKWEEEILKRWIS